MEDVNLMEKVKKMTKKNSKIKVTQVRSANKRTIDQKQTLVGLGIKGMNSSSVLENTPSVMGMVTKVRHLLKIEEVA